MPGSGQLRSKLDGGPGLGQAHLKYSSALETAPAANLKGPGGAKTPGNKIMNFFVMLELV